MLKVELEERVEELEQALADIDEELADDKPDLEAVRGLIDEALEAEDSDQEEGGD